MTWSRRSSVGPAGHGGEHVPVPDLDTPGPNREPSRVYVLTAWLWRLEHGDDNVVGLRSAVLISPFDDALIQLAVSCSGGKGVRHVRSPQSVPVDAGCVGRGGARRRASDRTVRRRPGQSGRGFVSRAVSPAVPFHAGAQLDE